MRKRHHTHRIRAEDQAIAAPVTAAVGENSMTLSTSRLIGILSILLLIIVVALGLGWFRVYLYGTQNESVWPESVVDTYRDGDFAQAVANRDSIETDSSKTEEEKAMAVFNALGAEYKVTGEISAVLKDIQDMKTIILNERLTPVLRAETLDVLAKEYAITGRNPAVFAEIYKDAPFSNYLAAGDPELSSRRLAEWSYQIMPSSNAAILVANWYTTQLLQKADLPKDTVDTYVANATDYLKKADAASVEEASNAKTYSESRRYMYYLFYRAVVIGQLSNYSAEFKGQYRDAFEKFLVFAQEQSSVKTNVVAAEFALFAHLAYAQQLSRDGDTAAAVVQLDTLAAELDAISKDQARTNGFFHTMNNERKNNPNGARWTGVVKMTTLSQRFKSAMENVVNVAI